MTSEKFEDHEEEFRTTFEDLENVIKNKLPRLSGEPKKQEIRQAEKLIEEGDFLLASMAEEAQSAPGAYRSSMMSKTRGYRSQLEKLKREVSKSSTQPSFDSREDLMGTTSKAADDPMAAQRNRYNEGFESLARAGQSVARSQRVAAETDEIGVQIIGDLDDQREALIRTKDKLKQTDADLSRSRKILNSMAIKVATNKLLLALIIFVELCILGAVIYIRFVKK